MGNKLRLWALLLVGSPAVWATSLCSNTTLDQYISNNPGGCQIGNTIFSNFSYVYTRGLGPPETVDPDVPASDVQIQIAGSPSSPILQFLATWVASSGFQTQITIGYTVSVPAADPLTGTSASLSGTVQNLGGIPSSIDSQFGIAPPGALLTPDLLTSVCGSSATTCTSSVGSATSLPRITQITVGDLITLDSGGTTGASPNTATLTEFQQGFDQSPEPSTLAAVCLGLALCGWLARRPRRA